MALNNKSLFGELNQPVASAPGFTGLKTDSLIITVDNKNKTIQGDVLWDNILVDEIGKVYPLELGNRRYKEFLGFKTEIEQYIQDSTDRLSPINARIDALKVDVINLEKTVEKSDISDQVANIESSVSMLADELVQIMTEIRNVENNTLKKLSQEVAERENSTIEIEKNIEYQVTILKQRLHELEQELEQHINKYNSLYDHVSGLKSSIDNKVDSSTITELKNEFTRYKKITDTIVSDLSNSVIDIDTQHKKDIQLVNHNISILRDYLDSKLQDVDDELNKIENLYQSLSQSIGKNESENNTVNPQISQVFSQIVEITQELQSTRNQLSTMKTQLVLHAQDVEKKITAIETVDKEHHNQLVTLYQTVELDRKTIESINSIVNNIKKYQSQQENQFESIDQNLSELSVEIATQRHKLQQVEVLLQQEIEAQNTLSTHIETTKNQLNEKLQQHVELIESKVLLVKQLSSKIEELSTQLVAIETELSATTKQARTTHCRIVDIEKTVGEAEGKIRSFENEHDDFKEIISSQQSVIEEQRTQLKNLADKTEEITTTLESSLDELLAEIEVEVYMRCRNFEWLSSEINKESNLSKERDTLLQNQIDTLIDYSYDVHTQIATLDSKIRLYNNLTQQQKEELQSLCTNLDELAQLHQSNINALRLNIRSLENHINEQIQKIEESSKFVRIIPNSGDQQYVYIQMGTATGTAPVSRYVRPDNIVRRDWKGNIAVVSSLNDADDDSVISKQHVVTLIDQANVELKRQLRYDFIDGGTSAIFK